MSRLSSDIIISSFSTPFKMSEFIEEGIGYKYLSFASVLTSYLQLFLPAIFYAQFGYLYSFAPSSFGKNVIDKLVKNSLIRNKAEAGEVYKTLKENTNTFFSAKSMAFMQYNKEDKKISEIAKAEEMRCRTHDAEQCVVPGPNFRVKPA